MSTANDLGALVRWSVSRSQSSNTGSTRFQSSRKETVLTASNGLRAFRYDLTVMDWQKLPSIFGGEVDR